MKRIYHLSTCSTCKRLLKALGEAINEFELIDIKTDPLSKDNLEELKKRSGSYEKIFSKTARKYRELGLKDKELKEEDFKKYLLEHYTFLKRPVLVDRDSIVIGSRAFQKYLDER